MCYFVFKADASHLFLLLTSTIELIWIIWDHVCFKFSFCLVSMTLKYSLLIPYSKMYLNNLRLCLLYFVILTYINGITLFTIWTTVEIWLCSEITIWICLFMFFYTFVLYWYPKTEAVMMEIWRDLGMTTQFHLTGGVKGQIRQH